MIVFVLRNLSEYYVAELHYFFLMLSTMLLHFDTKFFSLFSNLTANKYAFFVFFLEQLYFLSKLVGFRQSIDSPK